MEGVELTGFSNNYGNYNDEPSIIWTIEHDLEPEIIEIFTKIPLLEFILLILTVGMIGVGIGYLLTTYQDNVRRAMKKLTKKRRDEFGAGPPQGPPPL